MRSSFLIAAVSAAFAGMGTMAVAQSPPKPDRAASGAAAAGEEAAPNVDPAVLDRCRQQAAGQKLKDGPERRAFMGTCVTPED